MITTGVCIEGTSRTGFREGRALISHYHVIFLMWMYLEQTTLRKASFDKMETHCSYSRLIELFPFNHGTAKSWIAALLERIHLYRSLALPCPYTADSRSLRSEVIIFS